MQCSTTILPCRARRHGPHRQAEMRPPSPGNLPRVSPTCRWEHPRLRLAAPHSLRATMFPRRQATHLLSPPLDQRMPQVPRPAVPRVRMTGLTFREMCLRLNPRPPAQIASTVNHTWGSRMPRHPPWQVRRLQADMTRPPPQRRRRAATMFPRQVNLPNELQPRSTLARSHPPSARPRRQTP